MANPQWENGYTRISNEIMEALYLLDINIEAMKIIIFILRKTYGYHKKKDRISLSQFKKALKKEKKHICRNIKKLTTMKIIIKIQSDDGTEYEFNKNYEEWEVVPKQGVPQTGNDSFPKQGIRGFPKQGHTKETPTKENKQKKEQIDFELFWQAYKNKKDKHKAKQKWDKLKLEEQQAAMDYIPRYLETKSVKDGYQRLPTTFINSRTWENEIKPKEMSNPEEFDEEMSDMTRLELRQDKIDPGWREREAKITEKQNKEIAIWRKERGLLNPDGSVNLAACLEYEKKH